jgi:hypothetical protein
LIISVAGGTAGALIGFGSVAMLTLALGQKSELAVAGHGAGADVLAALVMAAGVVGAIVGGLFGAWVASKFLQFFPKDLAIGRDSAPA